MKKNIIRIVGWVISIALIVSLFIKLDTKKVLETLSTAKWSFLLIAATINIFVIFLKSMRWQWLLLPKAYIGLWHMFQATAISFAGNNVLPARGGDLIKIYLLGRWARLSKAILVSITGLEKIFDGTSTLVLFSIMSFYYPFPDWAKTGTYLVGIVLLTAITIGILLLLHSRKQT